MRRFARPNVQDFELVQSCISGDVDAWAELVGAFETTVFYSVRSALRLRGHDPSEDLVVELQADVFYSLVKRDFAKLRRYSGRARLKTWLKVVAGNYVIDHLRRQRPKISLDDPGARALDEELSDHAPNPEERVAHREARALLRELWESLGREDRRFVELFYEQELDFEEVARRMGTTLGAIYSRKNRVRNKLAALVRRREKLSELRR